MPCNFTGWSVIGKRGIGKPASLDKRNLLGVLGKRKSVMEYQCIFTIKESDKATVELAAMEGQIGPVVVKRLRGAGPDIYRLLCNTQNFHIPQVYACEQQGDELIVAEEYVDGENLGEYLDKRKPSDGEKLDLVLQLCDAVEFLHTMVPPVIHRDIKPSNIVITGKGVLKLIDFDASRQYKVFQNGGDTRLLGTVEYASPEQFGYSQTDARSDIYSMGVVFHWLQLTGHKKTAEQWEKIIEKCTSFDPKNRYQSVPELKKEIEKLKNRKTIKRRNIIVTAGIVMGIVFAVTILTFGMWQKQNTETGGDLPVLTGTRFPTSSTISDFVPSSITPSPTTTVPGKMSQIVENMVKSVTIPNSIPNPNYHYYPAEAERTELIFCNVVTESAVTLLGGACYQFETKEWIYIPSEMTYGGPTYYGVSDEFMEKLTPGIYHFLIARENELGQRNYMTRSVEVHSEEIGQAENLLTETELEFYSDYTENVAIVSYSDVPSKIIRMETRNRNKETEFVDPCWYDIICDGKVLLIKKSFLAMHLEKESLSVSVVFDDGKQQEAEVKIVKGPPPSISATQIQTEDNVVVKHVPNYPYYKALSEGTEMLIRYGGITPIDQVVLQTITCENTATGEVTEVPLEGAEIYKNFVKLPKNFLQKLDPAEYRFTVYLSSKDGVVHQSFSQNVEVYAEDATILHTDKYALQNRDDIYPNYTRGATAAIRADKTCRFIGACLERADGWEIIDSSCYEILCDGKVIMVKKEYLMPFVEEESVRLRFTLDNSGTHILRVYLHSELP